MSGKEIEQKFDSFYQSQLVDKIAVMEKERSKFKIIQLICTIIAIIMVVAVIAVYMSLGTKTTTLILMAILGAIGGGIFFASTKIPVIFREKIKINLLKPLLQVFGRFDWRKDELITLADIKNLGLYNEAELKKDDDIIIGVYDNIPLIFTETEISHKEQNKNETDFSGLIITAKLGKTFNCSVVAYNTLTIQGYKKLVENFSKKDINLCSKETLDTVKIPNLEKKTIIKERKKINYVRKMKKATIEQLGSDCAYDIFTDNPQEANKLISKKLIEKIQILQTIFNAPLIDFAFKNNNAYFFLHKDFNKKDYFEIGSLQENLSNKEVYYKVFIELIQVATVVGLIKQIQSMEE